MYSPQLTASTAIHASHCSTYFLASSHMPTMLSAVVKLSSQGTVLSVKFTKIHPITQNATTKTNASGKYTRSGVYVTGSSFLLPPPRFQIIHP